MNPNGTKPNSLQAGMIAVLGVPLDQNSSYMRGPASAPSHIREALFNVSSNMWTENGINLSSDTEWGFLDEVQFQEQDNAFLEIERKISELLAHKSRVITLGGDHSITYPIIRGYKKVYPNLSLLQLDAHPDLYDEFDGNRYSHACPFARIMEENLVQRLVQVGIRSTTGHQRQQANRFGVEVIEMREIDKLNEVSMAGPVYLSLDLDCIDPAFAPGVSHYEPGGMSIREVISVIQKLSGNLVGADIVEFNPERDFQGITAMAASKLLKEILGRMLLEE